MSKLQTTLPAAFLSLVSAAAALPQGSPTVAPGFRMYGPHGTSDTFIVDTAGVVVHTIPSAYNPGVGNAFWLDGSLIRLGHVGGGPGIGGEGGHYMRLAMDGTVLWERTYADAAQWGHHDVEVMPNGNLLIQVFDRMPAADGIQAGRDPAILSGAEWIPESIYEIEMVGSGDANVVWEWHMHDHLIQDFDPTKDNFGVVADHPELMNVNYPYQDEPEGNFNHANTVAYDPVRDLVLINLLRQGEFIVIDHSTTTAEAAGHTGGNYGKGGDILYRWGNPEAYDHGTSTDRQLFGQHSSHIIAPGLPGEGNVLIFNNQAGTPVGESWTAIYEVVLPYEPGGFTYSPGVPYGPAGPVWEYTAPTKTDFYSPFLSSVARLPNGNTFIDSGKQHWLFEVASDGTKVWEYFPVIPNPPDNLYKATYIERTLWETSGSLSVGAGGSVDFDLISGSVHAGELYLVLGSLSGTSPGLTSGGFTLPLNLDPYFVFTVNNAGGPTLPGTFGVLDGLGNGSASLVLGPGVAAAAAGLTAHHAYAVLDPVTLAVTHTSNAAPTELVP